LYDPVRETSFPQEDQVKIQFTVVSMEKTYYPFKLSVTVNSAENLPVADFTTSDPYVAVYMGDRLIGRTKTIKRNHLAPKWNEWMPHIPLLHANHELRFEIFDEDIGKDDDKLGYVKVDLKDHPSDGTVLRQRYAVTNSGQYKSKSFIEVTTVLARNDNVIQIQTKEDALSLSTSAYSPHGKKSSGDLSPVLDIFPKQIIQSLEKESLWETSSDVTKEALKLFILEDSNSSLLSMPFLRDLLFESAIFSQRTENKYYVIDVLRTKLKLQNSTKILLDEGEVFQAAPIDEVSLQINLSQDDTKFILLTFSNRFMIWSWVKWLRLAYEYWNEHLKKEDIPSWASSMQRASIVSVLMWDGRRFSKRIVLDLVSPFMLKIGEEMVSVRTMMSLMISSDSFIPATYSMELSLNESTLEAYQSGGLEGINVKNESSPRDRDSSKGSGGVLSKLHVGKALGGALSTVKTFGNKGKTLVKHTAVGVTTNAVNAVRVISTGDPTRVIRGAHDKLIGVTHSIATKVGSKAGSLFGKHLSFVSVKSKDEVFQFPLSLDCAEIHYVDFELADLYKTASILHRGLVQSSEGFIKSYHLFPVKKAQPMQLDVTLFHGVEGHSKVRGQAVVKVRKLINSNRGVGEITNNDGGDGGSLKEKQLKQMDILFHEPRILEVPLHKHLGYSITVVSAKNLVVSSSAASSTSSDKTSHTISTASDTGGGGKMKSHDKRNVFVKCKLVSADGRSGFMTTNEEHRSPPVKVSSEPTWNHAFTLLTGQYIDNEFFVRLEFFVEDMTSSLSIGSAFIPLEFFTIKEYSYTFPISRFRCASVFLESASNGNVGYGEVTVKIRKIEEEMTNTSSNRYKIDLHSIVKESSLFNTSWHGEILPISGIDSETTCVERALVTILHDGLQLTEQESMAILEGRKAHSVSLQERPTESWQSANHLIDIQNKEFLIDLFENERRSPLPPFDWSNSAYTRAHWSDLTFKKSYHITELDETAAPDVRKLSLLVSPLIHCFFFFSALLIIRFLFIPLFSLSFSSNLCCRVVNGLDLGQSIKVMQELTKMDGIMVLLFVIF
jgi:hypothetical protein